MSFQIEQRRYLTDFDSSRTGNILTNVLVIGTGVAGLRAAIEAARHTDVLVVSKGAVRDSATNLAQGGIAAAVDPSDTVEAHMADTLRVGCGICRTSVVQHLVSEAPTQIRELILWGMQADFENDVLALGREGGHSANRIVHACGDRTGRELVKTLRRQVEDSDRIRVLDHCFVVDLLTDEGACLGAVTQHDRYGHQLIWSSETILASGGCGRLWRETTNPETATGDGAAAAFRAGTKMCNLEFMQFHPTTLYIAGAGRALISEAVRGEGAYLVDSAGDRFMRNYDPAAELAPRDVVSRAIHQHIRATNANCVYLDVRHLRRFDERFPQVAKLCRDFEIDVSKDLIPVRPSAHYMIGGVDTALDGSTNLDGLRACGEVACSGVHGANRLASNSLLEGAVLGKLAGDIAGSRAATRHSVRVRRIVNTTKRSDRTELNLADIRNSLRSLMWRNVGIMRRGDRLQATLDSLDFWTHYTMDKLFDSSDGWEIQNQLTIARLVAMCALERTESVGVHYRDDGAQSPPPDPYEVVIDGDRDSLCVSRRLLVDTQS